MVYQAGFSKYGHQLRDAKLVRRGFTINNRLCVVDSASTANHANGESVFGSTRRCRCRQNLVPLPVCHPPILRYRQGKSPDTVVITFPLSRNAGEISPFSF